MPSSPDGAIDLNTIPSSLIGSVEVITGGASATYGSDAVAGVTNFKLRTNLDGLELYAKKGDRTSVVKGKSVSGRVDLGGGGILKKKKNMRPTNLHTLPHNTKSTQQQ